MKKKSFCVCGILLFFCFLLGSMISCSGNGSAADSIGEVYSSSGSATASDGSLFSAGDILSSSNAGDTSSILNNISGSNSSSSSLKTTTVTLSSSSIGLPSGGTVTLTITGDGVSYVKEATASSDGNVYFQVPVIATGTTVTVSIVVKAADGTVSSSGSKTQTVTDSSSLVDVSLTGNQSQVWSLPDPLTVSVSSASVDYTPTGSVTFSVVGVTPPASGTLSYSWEKADGSPLSSTSDSCPCSLSDLLGASPTSGTHNVTVTVTASYAADDGTVTTASGSGVVQVSVYSLPDTLTIEASPTSVVYNAAAPQDVTFSLTGVDEPPYGSLTYTWADADGNDLVCPASSYTGNLATLLGSDAATAGSHTVQVFLTVIHTADDGTAVLGDASGTGSVSVTVLGIPSFTIQITPPAGVSLHSGTSDSYDVSDRTKKFTFTAVPSSGEFPDDTTFEWTVNGVALTGSAASIAASPDDFSCGALSPTSAANNAIICKATSGKAVNSPKTGTNTLKLYKQRLLPSTLTITKSTTAAIDYDPSASPAQTVTLSVSDLPTLPAGTLSYTWKNAQGTTIGTDSDSITVSVADIIGGSPTAGTAEYTVTLTVTYTDGYGTQTSTGNSTVSIKAHEIPDFAITVRTLPAGMTALAGGALIYDVGDLDASLPLKAEPTDGSSFDAGVTFKWKVNGTELAGSTATASIKLSDYLSFTADSQTAGLAISCEAIDSSALNSPKGPVTKTLTFYKPELPKPVIGAPTTTNGSYIGASGTTYSFYAVSSGSASNTKLTFSLDSSSPTMPTGTSYNWRYTTDGSSWSSLTGNSGGSSYGPTTLGTIWTSSMPAEFQIKCTAVKDGYESTESDPITVKVLAVPSSISNFTTMLNCGAEDMDGQEVRYRVTAASVFTAKALTDIENGSGAEYSWYINGVLVKTTDSKETTFTVEEAGINVSSLPTYVAGANGTEVTLTCTISYPGTAVSKDSSPSGSSLDFLRLFK